jgi:alkylhydroperoxidase family enzyme
MSRLTQLTPDKLNDEQKSLYDSITAAIGSRHKDAFELVGSNGALAPSFDLWLHNPVIGRALSRLGGALRAASCLSDRLREIVILVVANAEQSEFEWHAHTVQARRCGVPAEVITCIENREPVPTDNEVEAAVVSATQELMADGNLSTQTYESCAYQVGPAGMVELTTLVGFYKLVALQHRVFSI